MKLLHLLLLVIPASSKIIQGFEPEFEPPSNRSLRADAPEHKGRKHCFRNPNLVCSQNRKCCTHVHQKKLWCCPPESKCGKQIKTCEV